MLGREGVHVAYVDNPSTAPTLTLKAMVDVLKKQADETTNPEEPRPVQHALLVVGSDEVQQCMQDIDPSAVQAIDDLADQTTIQTQDPPFNLTGSWTVRCDEESVDFCTLNLQQQQQQQLTGLCQINGEEEEFPTSNLVWQGVSVEFDAINLDPDDDPADADVYKFRLTLPANGSSNNANTLSGELSVDGGPWVQMKLRKP
jgi:hypothetical protein